MMKLLQRAVALATFSMLAIGFANAVTFTIVTGSNSPNVSVSPNNVVIQGSNLLEIQTPSFFKVNAGTSSASITYTVTADPGFFISGVTLLPSGVAKNAKVEILALHGTTPANFLLDNPSTNTLATSSSFTALSATSYSVTMSVDLTNYAAGSVSKVSIMSALYEQQPVPEPATMAALIAGLGALAARKKRGTN